MHDLSPFYVCAFCNVGRQTTAPALRLVALESTSQFAKNKFKNKTKLNNNNEANKERNKTPRGLCAHRKQETPWCVFRAEHSVVDRGVERSSMGRVKRESV